jgi:hypothetical protein
MRHTVGHVGLPALKADPANIGNCIVYITSRSV